MRFRISIFAAYICMYSIVFSGDLDPFSVYVFVECVFVYIYIYSVYIFDRFF